MTDCTPIKEATLEPNSASFFPRSSYSSTSDRLASAADNGMPALNRRTLFCALRRRLLRSFRRLDLRKQLLKPLHWMVLDNLAWRLKRSVTFEIETDVLPASYPKENWGIRSIFFPAYPRIGSAVLHQAPFGILRSTPLLEASLRPFSDIKHLDRRTYKAEQRFGAGG